MQIIDIIVQQASYDSICHKMASHLEVSHHVQVGDSLIISGRSAHLCSRDELAALPGVTLLPGRHGQKQIGALSTHFASLAAPITAASTTRDVLEAIGGAGLLNPEA